MTATRFATHEIVSPDGKQPLVALKSKRLKTGETIDSFLRRSRWDFDGFPMTVCFVNDEPVRPAEFARRKIKVRDRVAFRTRPGLSGGSGSSGGASSAKSIGAIVAMVSLAVLAPWAGGMLAGALGMAGATIGGVSFATIFGGVILAGGSYLMQQLIQPKAPKNATESTVYSITASGNLAKPGDMIPVGYGRRIVFPSYLAQPYSLYEGNQQWLYQLFCIGCGEYDKHEIRIDDTTVWTAESGLLEGYASNLQIEWVEPGADVTLFNPNVMSASEVSGQTLPSSLAFVGPFNINAAETDAEELLFDIVWPSGGSLTFKDRTVGAGTGIEIQVRQVDDAGVAITGWVSIHNQVHIVNSQQQFRETIHWTTPSGGGRYQAQVRRTNAELTTTGHDTVTWAAARARITGPNNYPGTTCLAIKAIADQTLAGFASRRVATIQTRRIERWVNGVGWVLGPTRNGIDAAIDIWRNGDYGADLSVADLILDELLARRDEADLRNHTFDHFFDAPLSVYDAINTALAPHRCMPSFIGDKLTAVCDQTRPVRMMFTDREMVRGSITVNRNLLDEQWADGVVISYLDENTWKATDAPSAEGLQRPARVELPGITKRPQAISMARYLAAVNAYRRRTVSVQVELEGRMLKRGDLVLLSSDTPTTWGQAGVVEGWAPSTSTLTLDRPVDDIPFGTQAYLSLRRRDGRRWGPVKIAAQPVPGVIVLNSGDLAGVESTQGTVADAIYRDDTEDPPTYAFGLGAERMFRGIIMGARPSGMLATLECVIEAPAIYDVDETGIPPIVPTAPIYGGDDWLVLGLGARVYQRHLALVLSAGWLHTRGAAMYVCQISIDGGTIWSEVYRNADTSFETAIIAGVSQLQVRVAAITPGGQIMRFSRVSVTVPDLIVDNSIFNIQLDMRDFQGLQKRVLEHHYPDLTVPPVPTLAEATAVGRKLASNAWDLFGQVVADSRTYLEETSDFGKATYETVVQLDNTTTHSFASLRTEISAQFGVENVANIRQVFLTLATHDEVVSVAELKVQARLGNALLGLTVESFVTSTLTSYATLDAAGAIAETKVSARLGAALTGLTVEAWVTQTLTGYTTPTAATAIAQTAVQARLGNALLGTTVEAYVTNTLTGYTTPTAATAIAQTQVQARMGDALLGTTVQAYVTDTLTGYVTPTSALSIARTEVQARLGNGILGQTVEGYITNTLAGYVTPTSATAIADTQIQAKLGNAITGTVQQYLEAYATQTYAQSIAETTVSAKMGNFSGTVAEQFGVYTSKFGELYSHATLTMDLNNYIVGWDFIAQLGVNNTPVSSLTFRVDKFLVGYPGYFNAAFSIVTTPSGARVGIDGSLIASGSVSAAQIVTPSLFALNAYLGDATVSGAMRSAAVDASGYARLEIDFNVPRIVLRA